MTGMVMGNQREGKVEKRRRQGGTSAGPEVLLFETADDNLTRTAKTSSGEKEKAPPDPLTPAREDRRPPVARGGNRT